MQMRINIAYPTRTKSRIVLQYLTLYICFSTLLIFILQIINQQRFTSLHFNIDNITVHFIINIYKNHYYES